MNAKRPARDTNEPAKGSAVDIPATTTVKVRALGWLTSISLARSARLGPLYGSSQRVQNSRLEPHSGPDRQPLPTGHGFLGGTCASTWAALIDRIAEGDIGACGTFYDESSGLAFSLIAHILQDREAAEDTLLALYDEVRARARRHDHRNRNPVSWFIELARSAALVRLGQQRQSRTPMGVPPLVPSPRTPVVAFGPFHRKSLQANRALAKLTQEQREIIQLVYFGGLSAREVANHLGLPRRHVTDEIQSAMQVLRDSLQTEAASLDICVLAV